VSKEGQKQHFVFVVEAVELIATSVVNDIGKDCIVF